MTCEILTDQSVLRQVSTPCEVDLTPENKEIVEKLLSSFPSNALGLAAPQIGIFKRMFVARLISGVYIFVNPEFVQKSPDMIPSEERCLSLPGVFRCVERYQSITIGNLDSGIILRIEADDVIRINDVLRLRGLDACIVQHEYDHLEGRLLIDLPETKTSAERVIERNKKRLNRIKTHRLTKKSLQTNKQCKQDKQKPRKLTKKDRDRLKKERQRLKKCVEVQERIRAREEGLIESSNAKS